MAREPKIPAIKPRPATHPKPVTQDTLEKYELKKPGDVSLGRPEQPDDLTEKVPLAVKRLLDQKAQIDDVFDRDETIHDVAHPNFGALGDGTTDDEPAFTLAIAALSVGDALYIPRGTFKLSGNVTIPAGNALIFESGASISIDSTFTFTVNGTLTADSHQIFAGAGTIDISGMELGADITEIDPVWFGNSIVTTFTDQDATPSVNRGRIFKTANTVATTITNFDDAIEGQRFTVLIGDTLTTIDFSGSNLKGNGGADWTAPTGSSMDCVFDGTDVWCDVTNDPNAGGSVGMALLPVDQPDLLADRVVELVYAHADKFPNGATLLSCGINTGQQSSTYSVDFQIRDAPNDASPTAVETVATAGTITAEDDGTLSATAVAAGEYVYASLPATDVDRVNVWITYTID